MLSEWEQASPYDGDCSRTQVGPARDFRSHQVIPAKVRATAGESAHVLRSRTQCAGQEARVGVSIICFVAYAIDKSAARSGGWRTAERTLLVLGLAGGWPGAILAQQLLRHKTNKPSFRSAFWGTVVLNVVAFVVINSPLVTAR